ncbi:MAG: FAD-dependent monooxygenase [Treponema sp.]|nr:FAD-dependent monooxygenase [Treponema sp.]
MKTDISVTIKPEDEHNTSLITRKALETLSKKGIHTKEQHLSLVFTKKSIDARHGQVKLCMRYTAYIDETPPDQTTQSDLPIWKPATGSKQVIIIGSGPAGLFGALQLLEYGIKPIIIERGKESSQRKKDIAAISTKNLVDNNSNYCFGEGGAGTFSDGKLYTRSNKRGDIHKILTIFHHFGADKKILTDAHPHIGTDRLPTIIRNMRDTIISLGGEVHFETKCTGLLTNGTTVTGVITTHCATGEQKEFKGDAIVLATGHSADDIYHIIAKTAPHALEAKTFAMGVRVEHPRQLIDAIQYHGESVNGILPTAEYRLTAQEEGRGVYSFCMCPGGFVVPSATGPDEIVVNGMSSAARNSKWSNAAIVVEIRPEDIPQEFIQKATDLGCSALAGLLYRSWLEHTTKQQGKGQAAPAQRLKDFLEHIQSETLPASSYTPGLVSSRIDSWMPDYISRRLAAGFKDFNKSMKGFICNDAVLIASETRTSTPVRITRDKETLESPYLHNLYPTGEGSGYSGGIVSSAMDGEKICKKMAEVL